MKKCMKIMNACTPRRIFIIGHASKAHNLLHGNHNEILNYLNVCYVQNKGSWDNMGGIPRRNNFVHDHLTD